MTQNKEMKLTKSAVTTVARPSQLISVFGGQKGRKPKGRGWDVGRGTVGVHAILSVVLVATMASRLSAADVRLGALAGFSRGELSSSTTPADVFQTMTFPIAGLVLEHEGGRNRSALFDLSWIRKGTRVTSFHAPGKARTDYLEATAFLSLHPSLSNGTGASVRPYVAAGPSFAVRIHEAHEGSAEGFLFPGRTSTDPPASRWFDTAIVAAVGVQVLRGGVGVRLEGRYSLGLTDVANGALSTAKTRGLQLRLAVAGRR